MKIFKALRKPGKIVAYLGGKGAFKWLPDKTYLSVYYESVFDKKLDLNNPKTFNEKLQWLKLYDRNPLYTSIVDKYDAKSIVKNLIGEEYIIPTLGVWERYEDIDLDKLPNQFVLKCTHDSGGLFICKDKTQLDEAAMKKKIVASLKKNFFWLGREWPYKNIKPRIIAEVYMEEAGRTELRDYKFMCFNGKVKCSFVCTERYSHDGLKVTFFDREWKKMPFGRHYPVSKEEIEKPQNYEKMIYLSEVLAKDIPFVRVDFYEIDGKVYFGEMTFYPGSGFEEFNPAKWDEIIGSWLKLES